MKTFVSRSAGGLMLVLFFCAYCSAQMIIDHTCTDITQIPESAINQAKADLHIGYGHTSHGSQITTGMTGLVAFANGGGKGLSLQTDIFAWNRGGTGGALDLREGDGYGSGDLDHDCGYYPNWVNETEAYLDNPDNNEINIIIWSWCGQAAGYSEAAMLSQYLEPMTQLENDYPNVTFVYMTCHLDGSGETGNLNLRNQQIRDYCSAHEKILYDFADIESYDPDGQTNYMPLYCDDACNYTGGNWAIDWQNSHTEGVDWYNCSAAHSQPLNGNQKAYTAWWLWARLAGWNGCANDCPGDINNDCKVDMTDFAFISAGDPQADIAPAPDGDETVDILDFIAFAADWLNS